MSAPEQAVVLSPRAEADVNNILLYTWQRWGEEQRDRYEATLDRALAFLAGYPEAGARQRPSVTHQSERWATTRAARQAEV